MTALERDDASVLRRELWAVLGREPQDDRDLVETVRNLRWGGRQLIDASEAMSVHNQQLRTQLGAALALSSDLDEEAVATAPEPPTPEGLSIEDACERSYDSGAADALESAATRLREALGATS